MKCNGTTTASISYVLEAKPQSACLTNRLQFHFYTMILAAIILIKPTINILLKLKVTIDASLAEPAGFTGLPDGDSTPPVVVVVGGSADDVAGALAGVRAGESTELAGDIALLVSALPGDEWADLGAAA